MKDLVMFHLKIKIMFINKRRYTCLITMSRVVFLVLVATWYGPGAVESRPTEEGHRTHRAEVRLNSNTTIVASELFHRVGDVHLVGPHDPHNFHRKSICQCHSFENRDENRIPKIIKEAKCVRPSSSGPHTCEDIMYNVLVQRVSESGELQEKIFPMKVGCATILPAVAHKSTVIRE